MSMRLKRLYDEAEVKPKNRDELLALIPEKDYSDDKTMQSFKDNADINKMLKKAQQTGSLAHIQKYPELVYGEFDGEFDLLTASQRLERAGEIFGELPSEIRKEFNNNPIEYMEFVNDPANVGRLPELLPAIAEPGRYFPNPVQRGGQGAAAATAPVAAQAAAVDPGGDPPAPVDSGTD